MTDMASDHNPGMRFRSLCLDAGGVLLHPDWTPIARILGQHGIAADSAALERAEPRARHTLDDPETIRQTTDAARAVQYFRLSLQGAGCVFSEDVFQEALRDLYAQHAKTNLWARPDPTAGSALRRIRAAGLRIAVVSNANGTVDAIFREVGLRDLVDEIVDSGLEGVEKPDPRIFHLALDRLGTSGEPALHVGDLYNVDVVGARAAGLEGWLFDPGGLYADVDCPRVQSLTDLAERVG
jgi:HAD superfamily hydrolase (TIGR01549 family)